MAYLILRAKEAGGRSTVVRRSLRKPLTADEVRYQLGALYPEADASLHGPIDPLPRDKATPIIAMDVFLSRTADGKERVAESVVTWYVGVRSRGEFAARLMEGRAVADYLEWNEAELRAWLSWWDPDGDYDEVKLEDARDLVAWHLLDAADEVVYKLDFKDAARLGREQIAKARAAGRTTIRKGGGA